MLFNIYDYLKTEVLEGKLINDVYCLNDHGLYKNTIASFRDVVRNVLGVSIDFGVFLCIFRLLYQECIHWGV